MSVYARYPVIVEYTSRHVVWVDADSSEQAARDVDCYPHEHVSDQETLFESSWNVRAPQDRWDWEDVYSEHWNEPYDLNHDAHVETHNAEMYLRKRAAAKAACTEAGHPDVESSIWPDRQWCNGCRAYLPTVQVEAGAP